MAIGEIKGKCESCGQEFVIRKKFYKRKEAVQFEENMTEQITLCPRCYHKEMQKKKEEEMGKSPIEATFSISKPDNPNPITISLAGGTYPVKDELKEMHYYWDGDRYTWMKTVEQDKIKKELEDLRKLKKVLVFKKLYQKDYDAWLKANHK